MRLRLPLLTVLALMALAGMAQAATNTKPQPRLELQHRAIGADGVQHLHFRFGPVRITPGQSGPRSAATG
jgi:hypothetical protein